MTSRANDKKISPCPSFSKRGTSRQNREVSKWLFENILGSFPL
jgi:hypothetical protein